MEEKENTEDRSLCISKNLLARVEQVWEVWTNPAKIPNWWGPDGFTTTIHKMEIQKGGEWTLTLHAPDGTNYPNRSIFREIIPLEKIAFEHFNPHFFTTVLFTALGEETRMVWTMVFDHVEIYETVVKAHRADEGLRQNVEKLEMYLSEIKVKDN